jgi:type I restriction enzyme S subunit
MASLNQEILKLIPLPLPSLPTQHAITRILGSLDDKIELNRQMNETLEAMARAIFQSWFVDFDPVRAKAEGRQPAGMDAETAALFPSGFEAIDGREVPMEWNILNLGDVCTLDKGVSYKGDFLSDEGTSMINLGCFTGEGNFSIENLKFYTGEYRDRHIVKPGDIVIANTDITQKREVLGSPAIVPPLKQFSHCIFTHHVFAIRFLKDYENLNNFVYFTLLHQDFRERAIGFATGTTVLALPRDTVLEHSFIMPDERIIRSFNSIIKPIFSMIYNNIEQSRTLVQIRDALLPKLISGEIQVGVSES